MKFKKYILYAFILLALLLSITAISAADLNNTDNMDVLNDANDKTFSELNSEISASDSKIDLSSDYKFNNNNDSAYANGIKINKKFVINGNGHTIDCAGQSRAFEFNTESVEINNLIIKNGFYIRGSAIQTDSNLILNNVTLINCSGNGTQSNGAINVYDSNLTVNNCKFIDNAGSKGASITTSTSVVKINNSTFTSSPNKVLKGQVYFIESNATITNSNFLNTTTKYAAAVFAEINSNIIISKTKFKNLYANKTAGAIGVKFIDSVKITDCEFDNVSSENNGGAIYLDINGDKDQKDNNYTSVTITGSKFNNCYSEFGGAILQLGGILGISASNFTSNQAKYEGGAIYTSHVGVNISDSRFELNSLIDEISYGGACYFDMGRVNLNKNTFKNNFGFGVTTIYGYDAHFNMQNNYFHNPSNITSIYTVHGSQITDKNNFTEDKLSFNNTNNNYNFENTASPFIILNNTLSFDKLPEKFDLRDYGWVTPVKNQGFMGACWAFGNLAAFESALLRYTNKTYSLSVNNAQNSMLAYSKYGCDDIFEGGLAETAIAYLIDWLGIFPEEYDGYDELGKISSLLITPENIHIQNAVVIPPRKNATDNDLIKNALIKYGAVAVSQNANFDTSKYFNKSSSAQYYTGSKSTHRVCVVGWDDNYSRNNFITTPPGDGAWICKNSWGTDWGDNGYFYISYYDKSFADTNNVCYFINNDSYTRIYQHDLGGTVDYSDYHYYSSIFTADEDELIAAVGTYFNITGANYTINITVNDIPVYSQSGASKFTGYETIALDKVIQIKKGDKFKVIIKNEKVPFGQNLRIETPAGNSFSSKDGKNWEDLAEDENVCIIKAYTVSDINITNNLVKYSDSNAPFVAKVGTGEEVTFQINGTNHTVKADANGIAKLEINYAAGNYSITTVYKNMAIVNHITIKNNTIISLNVSRAYNSNYNYTVQLLDSNGKALNNTTVEISINGKLNNYTTDKSGNVTIEFAKLTKDQTVTVTNPVSKQVKTGTVKVLSRFSGAGNVAMYYFDGSKFKAKIIGDDGTAVGANQKVTVKLNKKTYTVKTDSKGYITFKIPKTVKPGSYKLTATYKSQTITKTVKVKQNLKTKKYTVKKSAKKLVVKATLKNGKTALKNKKITLKVNGKKISAKTNKKGIAKLTIKKNIIKKLKAGKKYKMQVSYLKNTIKTTLKVKR